MIAAEEGSGGGAYDFPDAAAGGCFAGDGVDGGAPRGAGVLLNLHNDGEDDVKEVVEGTKIPLRV
jgi:hypothetical protein